MAFRKDPVGATAEAKTCAVLREAIAMAPKAAFRKTPADRASVPVGDIVTTRVRASAFTWAPETEIAPARTFPMRLTIEPAMPSVPTSVSALT
jgi:hypothetical protein